MNQKNLDKLVTEVLAIEAQDAREAGALGYMARALVQATLPHSRPETNEFERRNGAFTLVMIGPEPGRAALRGRTSPHARLDDHRSGPRENPRARARGLDERFHAQLTEVIKSRRDCSRRRAMLPHRPPVGTMSRCGGTRASVSCASGTASAASKTLVIAHSQRASSTSAGAAA